MFYYYQNQNEYQKNTALFWGNRGCWLSSELPLSDCGSSTTRPWKWRIKIGNIDPIGPGEFSDLGS